jgi:hypothetical protein
MKNYYELLSQKYPVMSHTTDGDKVFLLKTIDLTKEINGDFSFLEIGSFFGGTLAPFLSEESCIDIFSVDDRQKYVPDERGCSLNFSDVTTRTMIDTLHSCGLSTNKLRTHDGSIESVPSDSGSFDICFIDGEHTDTACFRDFIWILPFMKKNSIITFHDSSLIFKSLGIIMEYMKHSKIEHKFFKTHSSDIMAIMLGDFIYANHEELYGQIQDWNVFYKEVEINIIKSIFHNRVQVNTSIEVKDLSVWNTH